MLLVGRHPTTTIPNSLLLATGLTWTWNNYFTLPFVPVCPVEPVSEFEGAL